MSPVDTLYNQDMLQTKDICPINNNAGAMSGTPMLDLNQL
jgi:hypothetical protein